MDASIHQSQNKKTKIFIVDDHCVFREGLKHLIHLEEDLITVGEAANAEEALLGIEKSNPDLVIMDISLEGTSGLELTKSILIEKPNLLILIVSMYDESIYVERFLRAGARGYLRKQETGDLIVAALRKVLNDDIYVSDQWRDKLIHKYLNKDDVTDGDDTMSLSDRELEVFQLSGQGYSTRQIANERHINVKTVESHHANIKNKLGFKNSHEFIQRAVKWCYTEK